MEEEQNYAALRMSFDEARKNKFTLEKVVENFCETFLVDNKGRPLRLRPIQLKIVVETLTNRYLMLLSPRGSGKSKALGVAITMWIYFYQSGEKVGIVAPQMKQAKIIFSDVVENFTRSPILSRMNIIKTLRMENDPMIMLKGGSLAVPLPAETKREGQSIRGFHATFCVIDESPAIPDHLFEANIEPIVLANRAPFINIGTPKSKDNHTYRYMYSDKYKHFTRLKFTWRDAMVKGHAYETPWAKEDIEIKRDSWGEDSIEFRTEYMCEFIESSGQFFTGDDFKNSLYKTPKFIRNPKLLRGSTYMTLDLAESHNSVVYALWEAVPEDGEIILYLRDIHEIRPPRGGIEPVKLRAEILEYAQFFGVRELILDATGQGKTMYGDFKTEVRKRGMSLNIRPFYFSRNKGDQYALYKNRVRVGHIKLPHPSGLKKASDRKLMDRCLEQHFNISYSFTKDMKSFLISPSKSRRDDFPDCLCMSPLFLDKRKHVTKVIGVKRDAEYRPQPKNYVPLKVYKDDDFSQHKYGRKL